MCDSSRRGWRLRVVKHGVCTGVQKSDGVYNGSSPRMSGEASLQLIKQLGTGLQQLLNTGSVWEGKPSEDPPRRHVACNALDRGFSSNPQEILATDKLITPDSTKHGTLCV